MFAHVVIVLFAQKVKGLSLYIFLSNGVTVKAD